MSIRIEPHKDTRLEETRVIELGMLRGRFIAASIISLLILFLPSPGAPMLRPVPVIFWLGLGVLAYRATRWFGLAGSMKLTNKVDLEMQSRR